METWQLRQLQTLSLRAQITRSERKLDEAVNRFGVDGLFVAFSGGWNSTVLLHLARRRYERLPAVFSNTGQEYPEIYDHVKEQRDITWIKPEMTYMQVIEKYGYPVVSKKQAQFIKEVQSAYRKGKRNTRTVKLRLTGDNGHGYVSPRSKISKKWQFLCEAPFRISDHCCEVLKKRPLERYAKETGRRPITGEMVGESMTRRTVWMEHGCNVFNTKHPKSVPLSVWTDQHMLQYQREFYLAMAKCYGEQRGNAWYFQEQLADGTYRTLGCDRTGCMGCVFGCHMEKGENRFQRMYRTHPRIWKTYMDKYGLRQVLEFMGLPHTPDADLFSVPNAEVTGR